MTPVTAAPGQLTPGVRRGRLAAVCALAVVWFVATLFRLYWLQVEEYDHYASRAEEQQQRVVVLDPPRGTIYDARGRQLAVSVEVSSIAAAPHRIDDKEAAAKALASVLQIDREKLLDRLQSRRKFVWIQRKVDPQVAEAVRELELAGIEFLPESRRYYPLGTLAAQVLGYVGTDNSGLAGLEYRYNREVSTRQGQRTVMKDGRFGTVYAAGLDRSEARPGDDLHLTIDAAIQHFAERELASAMRSSGSRSGQLVMMDPNTGAIQAMVSYPNFDPNRFWAFPKSSWRNPPVMDAYEPGSTFKMVTLAAALEANAVDPLQSFFCGNGGIVLNGVRINDHTPFGDLTVADIMRKSSNVGAIKLGLAAGRDRLSSTIESFGFGRPTGIDLPSESGGLLRPIDRWSPLTSAYVSFGQGLSITALQLTNSFAAIANGGRLLRPYIVHSVGDEVVESRREVVGLPISPSSVRQIRGMLEGVVIDGTARAATIEGYRAAGKTGTAQKAISGGYAANRFIASFVGFAPVKDPALVMAVVLDEPWPRYHGGEVAAPVFAAVASQALLLMGVPPDTINPEHRWREKPLPDGPEIRTQLASRGRVKPVTQPEGTIPDFSGLSARQAIRDANQIGLRLAFDGHGAVARQRPAPGTPIDVTDGTVALWLTAEAM